MRILLVIETLLSLYLGINWGFSTAGSPGGKVVLSVVGVMIVLIVFSVLDVIVAALFTPRRTTYRHTPYTPFSNQTREEALESFRQRSEARKQALEGGMTPEDFDAEQLERTRQQQQAHDDEFNQRVRSTEPLPPTAE